MPSNEKLLKYGEMEKKSGGRQVVPFPSCWKEPEKSVDNRAFMFSFGQFKKRENKRYFENVELSVHRLKMEFFVACFLIGSL